MGSQDERKWWSDHPYLQAMKFGHLEGVPQPQVLGTYHGYDHHFLHPGMCFFREISPMPPTVDTVTPTGVLINESFEVMSFNSSCWMPRQDRAPAIWKRWNDGETTVAEATGCGRTALFGGIVVVGRGLAEVKQLKKWLYHICWNMNFYCMDAEFFNKKQLKGDLPNFLLFGRLSF